MELGGTPSKLVLYICNELFVKDCEFPELVGDGYCHDETNNADCNYDGGDCCLSNRKSNHCSECLCSTTGVITSPGFPQNHQDELDLTWIIQVPDGQFVQTNFISFDVQSGSNYQ